jgi:hypothetical protein
MTGPLALCLALHVVGAPPAVPDRPSLAPRLSLAEAPGAGAPGLAPTAPPPSAAPGTGGSFAFGWAAAAGGTLGGDLFAGVVALALLQPDNWAFQRWAESMFSGNGSSSLFPFLLVSAVVAGAGVIWGALPPTFALAGARRGLGVVPSPSTRTLTFLAHLAATVVALRVARPQTPGQAVVAAAAGDLLVVPLVAAGLTARDGPEEAASPATRARPERDPALALAR